MSELLNADRLRIAAEEYNRNFKWYMENQEIVKEKWRGKFVAVHNGNIYASENHDYLLTILENAGIADNDSVFKTYIPETDYAPAMS
jgi:hypothetical protein